MTLTPENTAIVLDSTADLADARERYPNMRVVPLYVHFGDETFRDGIDLTGQAFYERLSVAHTLPTTSQPTPHDFAQVYDELATDGFERIWSIHLSGKLSGTCQSAELAAKDRADDRVRVVDSGSASLAVAQLALGVERLLEQGTTDAEIDAFITRFRERSRIVFTVETLEFLQKGGRIGRAQALVGSLLNVRPILSLEDGVVVPVARVRGRQKALAEFERALVEATGDDTTLRVAIAHADAPEWVDEITELVRRARPRAVVDLVETLGAVVGTHAGPGAVGFFWIED
jgi:DegV family protein with EDD domain